MAAIAEAPATGIGKLLIESVFGVPTHQGNYRWKEDHVKQLFDDILDAIKRPDDDGYFLGLMVFMRSENGFWVVLDGQQRLATSIMILSAVRAWFRQYTEYAETSRQIQEQFIGGKELGETQIQPRLRLNVANNDTFEKYVINEKPLSEINEAFSRFKRYDPNKMLLEATLYCHKRVDEIVKGARDSKAAHDQLLELVKYLRDKVFVIRLLVSSDSNAYTIFETLNDRGLELSPLDLVKNYLFGRVASERVGGKTNQKLAAMESRWVQMLQTLSNVKTGSFIKAFWTSRHGRVQKANIFENLKKQYKSADNAVDVSIEMLSAAEQFAAIESGDDPVWSPYHVSVRETVRALKILNAEQTHPVILSGLAKFEPHEFERLVRLLEILIVRFQLIGGGRTGRLEITCARLARLIYEGAVTTATHAYQEMKDVFPSDGDFKSAFLMKEESNNAKAAYILRRLEREARRQSKGASAKDLDPGAALTVEHILPRNPTPEWGAHFKNTDEMEDAVFKIGNLCLVTKNKELGRGVFDEKKKIFATSDLDTTKQLADVLEPWNNETIKKRQEILADYAVMAWRFQ